MALDTTRQARAARKVAYTVLYWRAVALFNGQLGRRNRAWGQFPLRFRHDPVFLYRHGPLWVDRWRLRRGEISELELRHPYGRSGPDRRR